MATKRIAAGAKLAKLIGAKDRTGSVVIGIPKGGAVVGATVALELGLEYECVPVCRVTVPAFPALTLAAIDPDGAVYFEPRSQLTRYELGKSHAELAEHLQREAERCRGDRRPVDPAGRDLIIVDDAADSHVVAQAAAEYLRTKRAGCLIFAAPVVSREASTRLQGIYDKIISLKTVARSDVPGYYADETVTDEQVHECMTRAWDASSHAVHA